jgi:hypothetical protein
MSTLLTVLAALWVAGWLGTAWETRPNQPFDILKLLAMWPLALWEIAALDR